MNDGVLRRTAARVVLLDRDGRVLLGGDVVASGYLGNSALTEASFFEEEHHGEMVRW